MFRKFTEEEMPVYDMDMRNLVIERLMAGHSVKNVARSFFLSPAIVRYWWRKYRTSGVMYPSNRPYIPTEAFEKYLVENPSASLNEIAKVFGVSSECISTKLRHCGYVSERRYVKRNIIDSRV